MSGPVRLPEGMCFGYDPDDPRDLWENITPVDPAEFAACSRCSNQSPNVCLCLTGCGHPECAGT